MPGETKNSENTIRREKSPLLIVRSSNVSSASRVRKLERGSRGAIAARRQLDAVESAHYWAAEDLRQLILHVEALLVGFEEIAKPVLQWLDSLRCTAEDLQDWIKDGKLYEEGPFSKSASRGIDEIDSLLYFCNDEMVQLDELFINLDDETAKDALLTQLVAYWVKEVRDRTFDVYHLFIGAAVWDNVKDAACALDSMHYPSLE